MSARGITIMALGALGTAALIGVDVQGPTATVAALAAGVGTLAMFFVGSMVLLRGWSARAEVVRVDALAGGVEQEARVHLLEGRETQLVRQIEALEARREEVVAETAAANLAGIKHTPGPARPQPNLVMVANPD